MKKIIFSKEQKELLVKAIGHLDLEIQIQILKSIKDAEQGRIKRLG